MSQHPREADSPRETPALEADSPQETPQVEATVAHPEEKDVQPRDEEETLQGKVLRTSERKRTLTPKGRENVVKHSISLMRSCNKRMKKQVDIVMLLLSGNNMDSVNSEMNNIEKTYSEFTDSYARVCGVLVEAETEDFTEQNAEMSNLMEGVDFLYLECKEKVCSWLIEKEKQNADVGKVPSVPGSLRSGSSKIIIKVV